jgi:hypothetical protein
VRPSPTVVVAVEQVPHVPQLGVGGQADVSAASTQGKQQRGRAGGESGARKVLGWPKICELAHAFIWEYSYKGLKLAQLLGRHGVFLACHFD